ncbi:hypothetical protein [Sorangium cellulosum]|nr:hypothetical protein [Sorangium cellulosum]
MSAQDGLSGRDWLAPEATDESLPARTGFVHGVGQELSVQAAPPAQPQSR